MTYVFHHSFITRGVQVKLITYSKWRHNCRIYCFGDSASEN